MKKILSIIIVSFFCLSACASKGFRSEDNWEGLQDDFLQVFVVYELSEYSYEREDTNKVKDDLLSSAKRRAVLIIINYIQTKYPMLRDSSELDLILIECFEKPEILFMDCTETDCRALVSFNIAPALALLENEN